MDDDPVNIKDVMELVEALSKIMTERDEDLGTAIYALTYLSASVIAKATRYRDDGLVAAQAVSDSMMEFVKQNTEERQPDQVN